MNYTKHLVVGGLCAMAMTGASQAADIDVRGTPYDPGTGIVTNIFRLAGNTTWTSNNTYRMMGIILVPNGVSLTIEPGTVVRGANEYSLVQAGSSAADAKYRPGMLIVEKGGKLFARGTAKNPICFTDEWDNNFSWKGQTGTSVSRTYMYRKGSTGYAEVTITTNYNYGAVGDLHGVWGGIVLCGKAVMNNNGPATLGSMTFAVEGTTAGWGLNGGGTDDEDSSGEITYVQIRYGGSLVGDGKEINGLTMYGVGRGTVLHHIEVFNNQDDCIEWFGGTVEAKYLIAWGAGDDNFDSDCGFRGKNQFCFGVQRDMGGFKHESGVSDKGMEMDGYETANGQLLYSASQWANVTLIGNQYTKIGSSYYRNIPLSMRDNASPRIYNSIFMDFGGPATMIEDYINSSDASSGVSGTEMNVAQRFTWNYSQFPTYTATNSRLGTAIGRDGFYQTAANDDKQACIRGSIFWNVGKAAAADLVRGTGGTGLAITTKGTRATAGDYALTDMGVASDLSTTAGKGPWSDKSTYFTNWIADIQTDVIDLWDFNDADGYMPIQSRTRTLITNNIAYPITGAATSSGSYHLTQVDPRAANDASTNAVVVADGWLTPTAFRGAFAPDANWAKGWTTIDSMGVFGNDSSVPGGDVGQTVIAGETTTIVITNGVNGIVYQNASLITTGTGVTANTLQTSPVLTYTLASAGTYQLQSTPSLDGTPTWSVVKTFSAEGPVTVNLTDILAEPAAPAMFYQLVKQP
jgi:hypothetical protein